jgi:hypothetical protein
MTEDGMREIFWADELHNLHTSLEELAYNLEDSSDIRELARHVYTLKIIVTALAGLKPFFRDLPALRYKVDHEPKIKARQKGIDWVLEEPEEAEGVDHDTD